jgi:hypothetical protein
VVDGLVAAVALEGQAVAVREVVVDLDHELRVRPVRVGLEAVQH